MTRQLSDQENQQLAALAAAAEVASAEPGPEGAMRTEPKAFVWASVRRWPALHRAFAMLFTSGLTDESRLVTRAGAELAINAAWVVGGHGTKAGRYATDEERAKALEEESRADTLQWWKSMNVHHPEKPFSREMTASWETALAGAQWPEGLPDLRSRALATKATPFALELYDFSYRADSHVTHLNTWALISGVKGQPQLSPFVAVGNALGAAMLLLASGAEALQSEPLGEACRQVQDAMLMRRRVGGARP
jgi:hypothetical protein